MIKEKKSDILSFSNCLLLVLILTMVLVLTSACGKNSDEYPVNSQEQSEKQEAVADSGMNVADETGAEKATGFVILSDIVPDAIIEARYYSTYNFVGERIDGYEESCILITQEAAEALKKVSDDVLGKGYRLKIYDAYRPQMAVDHFVRWAKNDDIKMKQQFYPDIDKELLFKQGYIASKSGHSRGSTVDLTLVNNLDGKDVDMGGTFDYFGKKSHPDYNGEDITPEQIANRNILREVMMHHGFKPIGTEWWHYTLDNEPYPDTYFNFPVSYDSVR